MNSNTHLFHRLAALWRAEFLSPKDLVRRALLISALFWVVHLAGLRDFTSVLSGTPASDHISWRTSAFLGVGYIVAYLGFVLLVPVLLIGAGLLAGWKRWQLRMDE